MMSFLSMLGRKRSDSEERQPPKWMLVLMWIQERWWKVVMLIGVVFGITQTAGFTAFMIEEKQQSLGFGIFSYQQLKQYPKVLEAAEFCLADAKRDLRALKVLNWFNPITGWAFVNYGEATIKKLTWQIDSVETRLKKVEVDIAKLQEAVNPTQSARLPPDIADAKLKPSPPVFPVSTAEGGLRYPKQIDYQTHAERLNRAKDAVYVTEYGRKYHRLSCRSLKGRDGVRRLTESQATADDKTPCRRCKP